MLTVISLLVLDWLGVCWMRCKIIYCFVVAVERRSFELLAFHPDARWLLVVVRYSMGLAEMLNKPNSFVVVYRVSIHSQKR